MTLTPSHWNSLTLSGLLECGLLLFSNLLQTSTAKKKADLIHQYLLLIKKEVLILSWKFTEVIPSSPMAVSFLNFLRKTYMLETRWSFKDLLVIWNTKDGVSSSRKMYHFKKRKRSVWLPVDQGSLQCYQSLKRLYLQMMVLRLISCIQTRLRMIFYASNNLMS